MDYLLRFLNYSFIFIWLGSIVFFSFVVTPTLFKQIPREMTSKVLEALFPKYYFLGYLCAAGALLTHLLGWIQAAGGVLPFLIKSVVLIMMLSFTYYAGMVLYPEAHRLKIEMRKTVEEEVPPKTKAAFKKTHRGAVLLNMGVLLLGLMYTWLLVYKPSF